jgi:hypothetical protein
MSHHLWTIIVVATTGLPLCFCSRISFIVVTNKVDGWMDGWMWMDECGECVRVFWREDEMMRTLPVGMTNAQSWKRPSHHLPVQVQVPVLVLVLVQVLTVS